MLFFFLKKVKKNVFYHSTDQLDVNIPESLDPNIQKQQILSFDNRLNSNTEEEALIFNKLKEDIKEEEDIAMKSALLLQLLEVALLAIC